MTLDQHLLVSIWRAALTVVTLTGCSVVAALCAADWMLWVTS
jgi:hypothetical protein